MPRLIAAALFALLPLAAPQPAAAQQAVRLTTEVLSEQREPSPDGTTRVRLVPARRIVPGDRLVYRIAFRNDGARPAEDVVVTNPLPAGMIYAGTPDGVPAPELSVDGIRFGDLSQLSVPATGDQRRAATLADVRAVRWRIPPVAPHGSGSVAFRAVLK